MTGNLTVTLPRMGPAAWRIAACGAVFAASLVASRLLFLAAGVVLERPPNQAPESIAGYYLVVGAVGLAAGIMPVARGLRAAFLVRWLILSVLLFGGFGLSTTIEAAIYSTTSDTALVVALLFLPCVALAAAAAATFPTSDGPSGPGGGPAGVVGAPARILRLAGAVAAFPVVYFAFGVLVSPIVSDWYREGSAGLVLPSAGTIAAVQLARGVLHAGAVLPVFLWWGRSDRALVVALAAALFVFVAAYDPVMAYRTPFVLVIVHGIEVLGSSIAYAWIVVFLLRGARP